MEKRNKKETKAFPQQLSCLPTFAHGNYSSSVIDVAMEGIKMDSNPSFLHNEFQS